MSSTTFQCYIGRLLLLAVFASTGIPSAFAADFRWVNREEQGEADLVLGDGSQKILRYMYAFDTSSPERKTQTFKVFHHVFGPGTDEFITNGAGGQYPHHRGLYVGWMRTKFDGQQFDFWHCKNGAHQRHAKFLELTGDDKHGRMTAEIHWNDPDGKPVIIETRTIDVTLTESATPVHGYQIDWQTKLESQRGEIELDGDRQHAGFQFRAASPVAEANSAQYLRPKDFPQQPQAFEVDDKGDPPRHINLGWLAMTYPLGEKRYTIEYFEDPSLPKPSLYSERPYGRFGAFFRAKITPDKPLEMRYRIRVTAGAAPSRNAIQKNYDEFVSELTRKN